MQNDTSSAHLLRLFRPDLLHCCHHVCYIPFLQNWPAKMLTSDLTAVTSCKLTLLSRGVSCGSLSLVASLLLDMLRRLHVFVILPLGCLVLLSGIFVLSVSAGLWCLIRAVGCDSSCAGQRLAQRSIVLLYSLSCIV